MPDYSKMTKAQLKILYSQLKRNGVKASLLYEVEKLLNSK